MQTATFLCPRGHSSTEPDYCSECGARIAGSTSAATPGPLSTPALCPDCGTPREHDLATFCEVCGYNFLTGAHGEIPIPPAPQNDPPAEPPPPAEPIPPAIPQPATSKGQWVARISVDPSLRSPESPAPPTDIDPIELPLNQPSILIGRRNEARGIFPDLDLTHDDAVSRRHALLQLDPDRGLLLRDIGAANGTRLNDQPVTPMQDYPLKNGDEITLGHWSRIRIQHS